VKILTAFTFFPDGIQVIKWRIWSSLVHVERRRRVRSADKILVGKTERKKHLENLDVDGGYY
jgi:hypothetical protein